MVSFLSLFSGDTFALNLITGELSVSNEVQTLTESEYWKLERPSPVTPAAYSVTLDFLMLFIKFTFLGLSVP
jgi:hypothetical protein